MAKKLTKQGFSIQGFDAAAYRNTEAYVQAVDAIYMAAVDDFARMGTGLSIGPNKPFSFADYPGANKKANEIVGKMANGMQSVIVKGTEKQWLAACAKNDAFIAHILNTSALPKKTLEKFQERNLDALKEFQKRKENGLDVSKKIWNYTDQFKKQMELSLDIGIGDGRSAQELSRDLKQYLVDPDKLFRRVRDKHGNLVLSKNAKAFHPGQGKYRSSHKNALRLTRSEINMAYRTSDQLRWESLDFVVGFEVKLSNNHTLNGVPFVDVCDDLKGKYPKSFKFVGWHPQCRCFVVPILMDMDEFDADELNELKSAINGTEYKQFVSRNAVTDVPNGFKEWISTNTQRSMNWRSQPYFIRDNFKGGTISGGLKLDSTKPIYKAPKVATPTPTPTPTPKAEPKPEPTPAPQVSIKTIDDVINRTNEVGKDWFYKDFTRLEIERRNSINGSTNRNGTIWLKRDRMDNTIRALGKLANKQDITFEEADALATYWHEITHCRNRTSSWASTALQRSNMELANELVARKTLPEFYKAMGADKVPFPEFMVSRASTGYNQMVCNYDKLIDVLGVDRDRAINTVKDHLFNKPYTSQIDGLVDAIFSQKPRNAEGKVIGKNDIKLLIKRCSWHTTTQFEEIVSREIMKK
jgi:hypothetical protein